MTGLEGAIGVEFLDVVFTVGGADDDSVIAWRSGLPAEAPEARGEFRAGIIEPGFGPGRAVIGAELDARDAAVAAEGDPADSYPAGVIDEPKSRLVERLGSYAPLMPRQRFAILNS